MATDDDDDKFTGTDDRPFLSGYDSALFYGAYAYHHYSDSRDIAGGGGNVGRPYG